MRVAIIGGGAAGLMAAATLSETASETEVILIEKNNGLGKKVLISGGGRCNVTTGIMDVKTVLKKYPRGEKFLSSAMHQFPPSDVCAWFEEHDVPLKTEEDLRVFPVSDDGGDIVGVFEKIFQHTNVHVTLNAQVTRIEKTTDVFHVFLKGKVEPFVVDRVVLTTGGQAYRHTGSTGDGYAFAISFGHHLTPLAPSLNAFFTRESWPRDVSGLSFERATIQADRPKGALYTGPFLFTHKGVSGPAVFAVSSYVAFETYDATQPLTIAIDLFPDQSNAELTTELKAHITDNPRKSFLTVLARLIPKSLAEICCRECRVDAARHAVEMSQKDLKTCIDWLKAIPLHATGRGAGDEFVTAGGIDTKEVNPSTMESRLCPGLFFAGEILDIDGFTGGFNLQASWATGRLAGRSCL